MKYYFMFKIIDILRISNEEENKIIYSEIKLA